MVDWDWCDLSNARNWTPDEIRDYFDNTNVTLARLASLTGKPVERIKRMLLEAARNG